ncbi:sugar-binding transcriptional regulator [Lactovum odontotermitis]
MDLFEKKEEYHNTQLYKIAWLYYIEEMTQASIASQLGINRVRVVKLLEEAREKKIVSFHFSTLNRETLSIEKKLINKFGLKDVFIAPWSDDDNLSESLGQAAAMYLDDLIKDDLSVGIGYGETISYFLQSLARLTDKKISILSLTGGVSPYLSQVNGQTSCLKYSLIPSPLIMSSEKIAREIRKESPVKEVLDLAQNASIIVTSLGGMNNDATVAQNGLISKEEFSSLRKNQAVGDILMHFINKDGEIVSPEIEGRLISLPLESIRKKKNIVVVAGGKAKVQMIQAAIRNGYVNYLITDEETANLLLKDESE